jgi:hypothetical protein
MNFIIIGSVFGFFVGLLSNFFSCVTLQRQACLQTGVGHYLLYMSIINQITLGFLTARLVHLSIIITDPEPFSMINNVLCKLLNYFLVCLTRISYWFTSFVSLERVYTVIFLNNQWFKKPYVARRLIALTLLVISNFLSNNVGIHSSNYFDYSFNLAIDNQYLFDNDNHLESHQD